MDTATLDEEVTEEPTRELTTFDRCDRCSAQAWVVATMTAKSDAKELELLFCGHHGRNHTPALAAQGWSLLDFTENINEKPSVSANAL